MPRYLPGMDVLVFRPEAVFFAYRDFLRLLEENGREGRHG